MADAVTDKKIFFFGKNSVFYLFILILFCFLTLFVFEKGKGLENAQTIQINNSIEATNIKPLEDNKEISEITDKSEDIKQSYLNIFTSELKTNLKSPLAKIVLQIITIIIFARILGFFFIKIGQSAVTGEIVSGIILGPSLVGRFFPEFHNFIFPNESLKNLQILSQIGLILFMFIIGMELNIKVLRTQAVKATIISHTSMSFSYFLGVCLAYFLYENFSPPNTSFLHFGLFMGVSMSITAFPVLARIIQERQITKTKLGTIVLTCAAIDDITAWCVLATVIAIIKAGTIINSMIVIFLSIIYIIFMIKLVQPLIKRLEEKHNSFENISKTTISILFLTMLGSAYLTELIGIHALFGAFLAGVIMPENINSRKVLIEKIEDVSLVLLLPLFFVFVGLKTQIGLLNGWNDLIICLIIIFVAVLGKFLGCTTSSRFIGENWKDSLSIGALMNTKGLMELIVLNIGYDLGIFSPKIFAMMVVMAIATTLMTSPSLELINNLFKKEEVQI